MDGQLFNTSYHLQSLAKTQQRHHSKAPQKGKNIVFVQRGQLEETKRDYECSIRGTELKNPIS